MQYEYSNSESELSVAWLLNCAYVFTCDHQEDGRWIPLPESAKEAIYD